MDTTPPDHLPTVLHVEDDRAHRLLRRRALEPAGFRVIEASGIAEAWETALRERPDVVLTDIRLPDGDGYELTRRIKRHPALATTRVIQISAVFTETEHRIEGLDSGADAYLADDVEPAELAAVVRAMARGRRTDDLLRTLLDGTPMLVAGADAEGRLVVFNAACERATGFTQAEVIGRPFVDTLVSPAHREAALQRFRHASADELAVPHETWFRTASGGELPIEWRSFPVPAPGGQHWMLGLGQDVTARRQVEAALRESEARFRTMADTAPVMIWVTDAEGNVEFVNRAYCEFFGVTEEQMRGPNWQPMLHPEDAERYSAAFLAALRSGTPFFAEARVRRADGEWRHVASSGAPRLGPDGRPTGMVGSSPDITDMRHALVEARDATRAKDEFLATVAHELRQPIHAAQAALAVLQARLGPGPGDRPRATLDRQLQQMARLVDDLLDAAQIVRGHLSLRKAPLDVRQIVQRALETITPLMEERRHRLEVTLPEGPAGVEGDAARLQQVLVNLLSNAAKYTPAGGTVWLQAGLDDGAVSIRVRDTGVGIPAAQLRRIFDVFTRATDGEEAGFGIGLAVARRLVEEHGGSIDVRSEGAGRGSEFVVRLPATGV